MCIVDWIIAVSKSSMGGLAFFILIGIVIIFIISVIVTNKDKIHTIILVAIGVFYLFSKVYCGPSLIDVYRMKPMAEKISTYIVKHGIPKSLKDIEGLPYELEKCGDGLWKGSERCYFNNGYFVEFYSSSDSSYFDIKLYATKSLTGAEYTYDIKNKKVVLQASEGRLKNPHIYSNKTSGICNPMRQ